MALSGESSAFNSGPQPCKSSSLGKAVTRICLDAELCHPPHTTPHVLPEEEKWKKERKSCQEAFLAAPPVQRCTAPRARAIPGVRTRGCAAVNSLRTNLFLHRSNTQPALPKARGFPVANALPASPGLLAADCSAVLRTNC